MAISLMKKVALAVAGAALPLMGGCATGGYYDDGYYGNRYGTYGPSYYDPYYAAPAVGLGFGYAYSDNDYRRRDWDGHRHHDRRDNDRPLHERPDTPRDVPLANREQDTFNQGRDGRGWSRDGSHSGG